MPWNICVKIQPSEHDPYSRVLNYEHSIHLNCYCKFLKKVTQIFPGPTA